MNPWPYFLLMIELFIPQTATQICVQLNRAMLGAMVTEKAPGYYQYSDNLVKLILALVTATGAVMLPHVANAVSKGDMHIVNEMLYKSFNFVSAISCPMFFGLAAASITLATKYYGPRHEPVGPAMMIESIVILMIAWSNVLGVQYLIPLKKVHQSTAPVTCGVIVNIILNVPLTHFWGLNGAMWSTVTSEIAVTVYQLWVVKDFLNLNKLFHGSGKYLTSSFVMLVAVYGMNRNLRDSWLILGIEIFVGIVIHATCIMLLKVETLLDIKELINKKR